MEERIKNQDRVRRGKEIRERIIGEKEEPVEFRLQARVGIVDMANIAKGLKNTEEIIALKNLTNFTQTIFKMAMRYLIEKGAIGEEITEVEEALQVLEDLGVISANSTSISRGAIKRNRNRAAKEDMQRDMRDYHDKHPSSYPIKGITKGKITQEERDNFNPETYLQEIAKIPSDPAQEAYAIQIAARLRREKEIERKKREFQKSLQESSENPQGLHPSPRTDLKEGEADFTLSE